MAVSAQVKQCIDDASSSLRECLAFAARSEQPIVISSLTDILVRLESVEQMDEIVGKFGGRRELPRQI
jgi:hypothetical protein